jgi:hypothetical protein
MMKEFKSFGRLILAFSPPSVSYHFNFLFNSLKLETKATRMPDHCDGRPETNSKRNPSNFLGIYCRNPN